MKELSGMKRLTSDPRTTYQIVLKLFCWVKEKVKRNIIKLDLEADFSEKETMKDGIFC